MKSILQISRYHQWYKLLAMNSVGEDTAMSPLNQLIRQIFTTIQPNIGALYKKAVEVEFTSKNMTVDKNTTDPASDFIDTFYSQHYDNLIVAFKDIVFEECETVITSYSDSYASKEETAEDIEDMILDRVVSDHEDIIPSGLKDALSVRFYDINPHMKSRKSDVS